MDHLLSRRNIVCCLVIAAIFSIGAAGIAQEGPQPKPKRDLDKLIVHEWGTFTELQNDSGTSLPGINNDDEPVPDFVHGFGRSVLSQAHGRTYIRSKSLPRRLGQVVMRLETPVIYFYPPVNATKPIRLDVHVGLKDGWLSEFYPMAEYEAPGLKKSNLAKGTMGTLLWKDLLVGTEGRFPDTNDPVWLNPRATRAAGVTANNGESERYLFYRGVGNFEGPVRVTTDRKRGTLSLVTKEDGGLDLANAWLVQVNEDQTVNFTTMGTQQLSDQPGSPWSYQFCSKQATSIESLKDEMHQALVDDGLYSDEATAMLNTWNHAYFQTPGLRIFYLVPQDWTDRQMPLTISQSAEIDRVMVGRIELMTDRQQELIKRFRALESITNYRWTREIPKSPSRTRFLMGYEDFGDLGIEIPEDFQLYLDMGRFRNAILNWEQKSRPHENVEEFIKQYGLRLYFPE